MASLTQRGQRFIKLVDTEALEIVAREMKKTLGPLHPHVQNIQTTVEIVERMRKENDDAV